MPHTYPALHNAMWPGLVGKGPGAEPFIDLDTMLRLTADANVDGSRFEGVDLFLSEPHVNIDSSEDDLKRLLPLTEYRQLHLLRILGADLKAEEFARWKRA